MKSRAIGETPWKTLVLRSKDNGVPIAEYVKFLLDHDQERTDDHWPTWWKRVHTLPIVRGEMA